MPATSFDFDVITGPSTPREERGDAQPARPLATAAGRDQAGDATNAVTRHVRSRILVAAILA